MKPITEQERQALIAHGNELKGRIEQYGYGREFESKTLRLVEIALTSLTADPIIHTSDSALIDVYCGGTGMMGLVNVVGNIPLYIAPPATVIELPDDGFTSGRWCPEDREGYANGVSDCIDEINRLNGIK